MAEAALDIGRAQGRPDAGRTHGPPEEKKQAAVTTGSTGIIRPSLREGLYGLYVLSPGTGSLAPVTHPRHAASLASAPGCQDHTTSPSVPACARLAQPSRPSQPASTYRDDAYAPRDEAGWRHQNMISEKTKQIYFSRCLLTRRMRLMPWTKSGVRRAIKAFPLGVRGKYAARNRSTRVFRFFRPGAGGPTVTPHRGATR